MKYRVMLTAATALAISSFAPAQAQGLLDFGRMIIGLPAEEKDAIDYRERAPLVVPPGQTLRPPQEGGAPDQRRANWPQDPDVLARRKAADDARGLRVSPTDNEISRRMTVEEVRAQRRAGGGTSSNPTPSTAINDNGSANMIGGIFAIRKIDNEKKQTADVYVEPKREFLTEPPVGLRTAAGNAPIKATRDRGVATESGRPDMFAVNRDGPSSR